METPLVTVFIPLYNAENFINDALQSIVEQTYENLEILIVDDGSTDKSLEFINVNFKDKRIRIIKNGSNMGIPYTRNVGLQNARGKYLALMDSDDIAYTSRIEEQVNYMEKYKDVDAIASYTRVFGEKVSRNYKPSLTKSEEIKAGLLFFNRITNPTAIIRMESLKKYNLKYNETYFVAQDYDFWAQLSKVGKLEILPKVLLKYRTGHDNITKKSKVNKNTKRKNVLVLIRNDLLNHYGFNLDHNEREIFHSFFSEDFNKVKENCELTSVLLLIKKVVHQNNSKKVFDEEVFKKVLMLSLLVSLTNQSIKLKEKINFYKSVCREIYVTQKVRDITYIVIKEFLSNNR